MAPTPVRRIEEAPADDSPWAVKLPVIRAGSPDFAALTLMSAGVS